MLMQAPLRLLVVVVCSWATCFAAVNANAQTFALDASSPSLAMVGATTGTLLAPVAVPAPGPLAAPVIARSAASLNLLAGDVIDAISYGDDGTVGDTLYFTVERSVVGVAGAFPPDVF